MECLPIVRCTPLSCIRRNRGKTRTTVGGHRDRQVGRKHRSPDTVLESKEQHVPKHPNTGSCTVFGGSALPPHAPRPPRPPPTGTTTSGLDVDRVDESEVFHQLQEDPVPLRRFTREQRPPERLRDYVWKLVYSGDFTIIVLSRVVTVSVLCT